MGIVPDDRAADLMAVQQAAPDITDTFVDLHIHIGRTEKGAPVKISGSKELTFYNIAREASERKGIGVVGIIDCHSPTVQEEIEHYLDRGEMVEQEGGGIRYRDTSVLLGSEIEVKDPGMGAAHLLAYLPTLSAMKSLTAWMRRYMKNVELSSQRIYVTARELQEEVIGRGGLFIPAHIFTPHKGAYGSAADKLAELLELDGVSAVELGLSADTEMASYISELDPFPFVTNSDAHSLAKIGREYNRMALAAPTFAEVALALKNQEGRRITANFGLNPRLGKYHRTYCSSCESIIDEESVSVVRCPYCGDPRIVRGVMDRILSIADRSELRIDPHRPPYIFQVPLEFIPGLGPKKMGLLLDRFGTEMNILHRATESELAAVVGEEIASYIVRAREGRLNLNTGGGGKYGRVID
jgi:uncharacterized protein (TIGR00375 family)